MHAGQTIEVTKRGEVVALLVPVRKTDATAAAATLRSLDSLRAAIAEYATEPTDVSKMLGEMRR